MKQPLQGMPYQPIIPSLASILGRPPRILLITDSILNSVNIVPGLQALFPGLQAMQYTYGGSQAPIGLAISATEVQAYMTPGNLLNTSTFVAGANTTVTSSTSPTTGKPAQLVSSAGGVGYEGVTINGTIPSPAPANLTFSFELEPNTCQTIGIGFYNVTKAGTILADQVFRAPEVNVEQSGLPWRYYLTVSQGTGVGWSAGDTIQVIIWMNQYPFPTQWQAFACYVREPMLNADQIPAPYFATTGTPQAVGTPAWGSVKGGIDRTLADLAIVEFCRNDLSTTLPAPVPASDFEKMISSIISGAASLAGRVMVCTPPPIAGGSPLVWITDIINSSGYYNAIKRAAYRHGAYFYDAVADFKALVASGQYTVPQLMRDIMHPTDPGPGINRYTNAIATYLNLPYDMITRPIVKPPCFRIGGVPTVGTWPWTGSNSLVQSGITCCLQPQGIHLAHSYYSGEGAPGTTSGNAMYARCSSNAGDTLDFPNVIGSIIGLIVLHDGTTAGVYNIIIDGGSPIAYSIAASAADGAYPFGVYITGSLPYGSHDVQVQVQSGLCKVVGIVGC